jgi:glycosyltransferase involved in cell wall biosynthesis
MKVIIIGTLPSSLINFRGQFINELSRPGHDVVAMASGASLSEKANIESMQVRYIDYNVERSGVNIIKDLKTFFELRRTFEKEKPDIIIAYTIKPIIWGGIAARVSGIKNFYGLVTGLGFVFQKNSILKSILMKIVKVLYRTSLKQTKGIIFQNKDNMHVFIENKLVDSKLCSLVNGSGVDLTHFSKSELTKEFSFLLIARLLGDKGIREYAKAAAFIKAKYPNTTFNLVGPKDPSPDGISLAEVTAWHDKGDIKYHGGTEDVRPYIEKSNVFVLPSYHEGMPRTVLEAMAMGRPILTTNVPGCKETVVNGENGWLVEKANVEQLAEKMIWFIENQGEWQRMGDISHQMAIEKFDVNKVNQELLKIMGLDK